MSPMGRHLGIIMLVAGVVLFTNLGSIRLWDRDEPRNAGCAKEMLERGDWVTPVFDNELRIQKPVLLYWLMMAAYSTFGVNEFAARFWSVVLGLGTIVCTYAIGRRLFRPSVAMWACLVLSTTIMFDVAARAATPDSLLIFFSTLALTFYVLGTFEPKYGDNQLASLRYLGQYFPRGYFYVVGIFASMALAVLAKGPVGLVLPTAVIGMFMLIMRIPTAKAPLETAATPSYVQRLSSIAYSVVRPFFPWHFLKTCWAMRPLTAIALTLVIAGPWYVWVGLRTDWEWPRCFFITENMARATTSMENHRGSFLFYPVAILVGFFPWSIFAGPVIVDVIQRLRKRDENIIPLILLSCWVCVWVGAFTIAKTKLPSYITPIYPALALLVGFALERWISEASAVSRWWWRASFTSSVLVGGGLLIALPIVATIYFPGDQWLALIGLCPLVGGVIGWYCYERQRTRRALVAYAAGATLFCVGLFGVALKVVDRHQHAGELIAQMQGYDSDLRVGSFGCLEPTWVFYSSQQIEELVAVKPAERLNKRTSSGERKEAETLAEFFADDAPRLLITTDEAFQQARASLPRDVVILHDVPYFLENQRLLLVGRQPAHDVALREASTKLYR